MTPKRFHSFLIIAILFLLTVYLYKDIIFVKGKIISFLEGDVFHYNFPSYYLTFGQNLSLWNPHVFLGEPLINHPANALFYPLNFIFFFLPIYLALNYSFVLNTMFMGICLYLYVRYLKISRFSALIAAVIFMFNGTVLLHTYCGHLATLQTLPWLALLFLLIEICLQKKSPAPAIIAGLVLGIQLLAGNAQYAFYAVIAASGYFLFLALYDYSQNREFKQLQFRLFSYVVLILIGLGVAAIKLIPALEFTKLSDRYTADLSFVASWSLPARNLITYFLPEFYGDILQFPYWGEYALWEMCGYVGILPLILSIIAIIYRRNRYTIFFAGLSVVALLGALGINTPLFKIFYYFLPGFNKFRGHSKMIILFAFSISVLSAYGLSWLLAKPDKQDEAKFKCIVWVVGAVCGLAVLFIILLKFNGQFALECWRRLFNSNNWSLDFAKGSLNIALVSLVKFAFFITASFCVLFFWMRKKLTFRLFKFLILILVVGDLWLFGSKYIVAEKLEKCYWDRNIIRFLKESGPAYTYRVMSPHEQGPFPNKAWVDGLHMLDGYDAIFLRRFTDLFNPVPTEAVDSAHNLRLLRLCNLKFMLMPKTVKFNNPNLIPVYETDEVLVWQNLNCLPRAYIVHGSKLIEDAKERARYIFSHPEFDPSTTVILEEPVATDTAAQSLPQQPGESVEFLKYSPDEVVIKTMLKSDGYLILSDFNYPGWIVNVLNLETGHLRSLKPLYANNMFRAVGLSPGKYSLRFVFKPGSFYAGCRIAALTIILAIAGLVLLTLKRRRAC